MIHEEVWSPELRPGDVIQVVINRPLRVGWTCHIHPGSTTLHKGDVKVVMTITWIDVIARSVRSLEYGGEIFLFSERFFCGSFIR